MGAWIYGIAWGGQYLRCYSGNKYTLYKYDPVTDNIISKLTFGNYMNINGLAYNAGFLYLCVEGYPARYSLSPFNVKNTCELKGYHLYGITYDGTSFRANA